MTVATDRASYTNGQTATFTVTVKDAGTSAAITGAAVHLRITTPKGKVYTKTGTTSSTGVAIFTHTLSTRRDGSGTYTAAATATASGYTDGSGQTTFTAY